MTMQEPFTIEYGIDRDGGRYWMITIPHGREWKDQYYALGFEPPNFPVPAIRQSGFITQLWIAPKSRYKQRKVDKWFFALCFDEKNIYID
jgi:hypothetical protein